MISDDLIEEFLRDPTNTNPRPSFDEDFALFDQDRWLPTQPKDGSLKARLVAFFADRFRDMAEYPWI